MGLDVPPLALDMSLYARRTEIGLRVANTNVPAGNTITATTETPFASKAPLSAGALAVIGTRGAILLFGLYSSTGITPSITPRIRIAGVELFPTRSVTGLLASTGVPWQARADFIVTDAGIVATGALLIDDNQIRRFGGPAVGGIDLTQALDITGSVAWGQTGCSITLQGLVVEATRPAQ